MNKQCLVTISILLLIIAGGVYKFLFQGNITETVDNRIAIHLTDSERDLVLLEMRTFLSSVQQITSGVASDNMQLVIDGAKKVGAAAQAAVPGTLVGKLPMEFKTLGFDTHTQFDQLAMDAESFDDKNHTLSQLSALMQNCVACHQTYRFDVSTKD